jgi:hypothetical protein
MANRESRLPSSRRKPVVVRRTAWALIVAVALVVTGVAAAGKKPPNGSTNLRITACSIAVL